MSNMIIKVNKGNKAQDTNGLIWVIRKITGKRCTHDYGLSRLLQWARCQPEALESRGKKYRKAEVAKNSVDEWNQSTYKFPFTHSLKSIRWCNGLGPWAKIKELRREDSYGGNEKSVKILVIWSSAHRREAGAQQGEMGEGRRDSTGVQKDWRRKLSHLFHEMRRIYSPEI